MITYIILTLLVERRQHHAAIGIVVTKDFDDVQTTPTPSIGCRRVLCRGASL
jgi:hypothetical protein